MAGCNPSSPHRISAGESGDGAVEEAHPLVDERARKSLAAVLAGFADWIAAVTAPRTARVASSDHA